MSLEHSTTYRKTSDVSATADTSVVATLLPIVAAVFVAYLVIGLALPVVPLHALPDSDIRWSIPALA